MSTTRTATTRTAPKAGSSEARKADEARMAAEIAKQTAPKPAPKATPKSKVEQGEQAERDFRYLADKEPTDLHKSFAAWIEAETGIKPDLKTVQIVSVLRNEFQRSEANQRDLEARRQAAKERETAKAKAKVERLRKELEALKAQGVEI